MQGNRVEREMGRTQVGINSFNIIGRFISSVSLFDNFTTGLLMLLVAPFNHFIQSIYVILISIVF